MNKKELKELKKKYEANPNDLDAKYEYAKELINHALSRRKGHKMLDELDAADYIKVIIDRAKENDGTARYNDSYAKKALEYYLRAAKLGDSNSILMVGYFKSFYADLKEPEVGHKYLEKASKLGEVDAWYLLGYIYEMGIYKKEDLSKAYKYYSKGAKAKQSTCQKIMKLIEDWENEKDYTVDLSFLQSCLKSFIHNNEEFLYTVHKKVIDWARSHDPESETSENDSKYSQNYILGKKALKAGKLKSAAKYFYEGFNKDDPYCTIEVAKNLLFLTFKDIGMVSSKKGFEIIKQIADGYKIPEAQYVTSLCYLKGLGTKVDVKKCIYYNTLAIEQQYIDALALSAYILTCGLNAKNMDKHINNISKIALAAIAAGAKKGFAALGFFYMKNTPKRDFDFAKKCFINGTKLKDELCWYYLGLLYENEAFHDYDLKESFKYYLKSAELGYPRAMSWVAYCYGKGRGVVKDFKKAVEWARKSTCYEIADGEHLLGELYEKGLGVEKDQGMADYFYKKSREHGYED